ncbi:MAG: AraC family transcriptional regulator [Saprospiraceae bacterium]|nr:AraC family transcriptional regulator [Saprospiraceae bacterium]
MLYFNARFIAHIIQFAGQQGADKRGLVAITGKTMLEELNDPALRFEAPVYNRVLEQSRAWTADEHLGLHMGEFMSLSAAGLIVQIAQSSRTVLEALHYMVAFANLGCSALPYQLRELPEAWELFMVPAPLWVEQSPEAVRHTLDGAVLFTLRAFQSLTRQQYKPLRVHFTYPRPGSLAEYERLFPCPVYFNQATTAIWLDKSQVAQPVITSDFDLLRVLVRHAEEKLALMQQDTGFVSVVQQSILHLVRPQFPGIEQVAANLNLSVRSLQRRLQEAGQSFQSVLDTLRHRFALDYLRREHLSVKEIAYLLDYADVSSFIRSFKRWEGRSPADWRRAQEQAGP